MRSTFVAGLASRAPCSLALCSVMSFVGYDYHKERERRPSDEWQSLTDEELPTGDDGL